ncbi:helix-turn-helix domain-containing protein [Streptomyces sp. NPDC051322]|uniref:helix-turn-helix domain-containing protein n=1 Tax=Streptomyces sp. NPDC051322 TaxID=3154645 RepID=UPI00344D75E0
MVGNHLAQHPDLSLTAIGLATHIQSLPDGARVSIRAIAAKFQEGAARVASALRELETFGYVSRTKERLPSGQIVTRTTSYNTPHGAPTLPLRPAKPARAPLTAFTPPAPPNAPDPEWMPTPAPEPGIVPAQESVPPSVRPTSALLPAPRVPDPDRSHPCPAAELLAGLRARDPRLLLSARDIDRLTGAVSAWLERGIDPAAVQHTLTASLPQGPLRHPAGFLAHRLTALLPPPLPLVPAAPAHPYPLQNCDTCDRAFRAPEPGRCRDCASYAAVAA